MSNQNARKGEGSSLQPLRSKVRRQSEIRRRGDCGPRLLICEGSSVHQLHELVGPTSTLGLKLQEWDGALSALLFPSHRISDQFSRTPTPIIDREGRVVAILAGRPADDSWDALSTEAAEALEEARRCCNVPAKDGRHRRGHFLALRCGVSHGSGQPEPGNLQNNPRNAEVLAGLNQKLPLMRMSGFATSKSAV